MIQKYRYIHFVEIETRRKTTIWECRNNNSKGKLGYIEWYAAWRQYCFFPEPNMVFNVSCLEDINHFMGQLMDERKS